MPVFVWAYKYSPWTWFIDGVGKTNTHARLVNLELFLLKREEKKEGWWSGSLSFIWAVMHAQSDAVGGAWRICEGTDTGATLSPRVDVSSCWVRELAVKMPDGCEADSGCPRMRLMLTIILDMALCHL